MSKDLCLLYVRDMYKRIKLEITILEQIDTPYQLDLQTPQFDRNSQEREQTVEGIYTLYMTFRKPFIFIYTSHKNIRCR